MKPQSRTRKSLLNAKVGAACYMLSLLVSFFSRGIFLRYLGEEFLGLTGSIGGILNFLNIAELGISTACSMVLYAPLFRQDQQEVQRIVSVLGYLYRQVGLVILCTGVLFSFFLPLVFVDTSFSWWVLYAGFYAYLFTALIGYFVNYHAILLSADQRNYIVAGYYQLAYSAKVILQLVLAIYTGSFILFFLLELLYGLVYSLILHRKVLQTYPWLTVEVSQGRNLLSSYPQIVRNIRQMFAHKLGGFVQNQSSPLFIYGFVSLPMVALYGNYTIISGSLRTLLFNVLSGTSSSIGNLVAEGDQQKCYVVYKQLLSFRIFVIGLVCGCFYFLASDFVSLWLGSQYVLSHAFVLLITIHLFLYEVRDVTDQYLYAYGLTQDVWSPFIESLVFIAASSMFGYQYGLEGVLLGPIISLVLIIYTWKPFYLFSKGFHRSFINYLIPFIHYFCIVIVTIVLTGMILDYFFGAVCVSWIVWFEKALFVVTCLSVSMSFMFWVTTSSFRNFCHRLLPV